MKITEEFKMLYYIALSPIKGSTHAKRMESLYENQSENFDRFRKRLLHGRKKLITLLDIPKNSVWVDLGGATGSNLEYLGEQVHDLKKIYIVDIAPSLLRIAEQRIRRNNWTNVEIVQDDATRIQLKERADIVTFSYSLSMIPDWNIALENAFCLLAEDGKIGVVDYYLGRKHPQEGMKHHNLFNRFFWQLFFSGNDVFPSTEHIPFLRHRFRETYLEERAGKIPYLPFAKAPYYLFIGKKQHERSLL